MMGTGHLVDEDPGFSYCRRLILNHRGRSHGIECHAVACSWCCSCDNVHHHLIDPLPTYGTINPVSDEGRKTGHQRLSPMGLALLLACGADPEPVSAPAPRDPWSGATHSEPSAGAVFESCASCHIADGSGRADGTIPRLAGQPAAVTRKKLRSIADGTVLLPAMSVFARALTDAQIDAVSTHIAALPTPAGIGIGPEDGAAEGGRQYSRLCLSCHGSDGRGSASMVVPALCGQHYEYLLRRVDEIKHDRRGGTDPLMRDRLLTLDDASLSRIAAFLSREPCTVPALPDEELP